MIHDAIHGRRTSRDRFGEPAQVTSRRGARISLRPATPADTPTLFVIQADPVGSAMAAFVSRDREAFESHQERILADPACLVYAIELDGRVVGSIGSWDAEEDERAVGYWLARDQWGKGFATQALRAFIQVDETRPLFGYVAAHNEASQRVLLHAGFVEVRRQPSDDVDEIVFRLDATE